MEQAPTRQALVALLVTLCLYGCSKPQPPAEPKEPKPQGLLLRDYQPKSMLVTEQHSLEKAKFPVGKAA